MRPSSWVIKRKATGEVVAETFSASVAAAVNRAAYDVVPILEHLASLNQKAEK